MLIWSECPNYYRPACWMQEEDFIPASKRPLHELDELQVVKLHRHRGDHHQGEPGAEAEGRCRRRGKTHTHTGYRGYSTRPGGGGGRRRYVN